MEDLVSHTHKVQPRHLRRSAYLYIRQSSMRQVLENTESTRGQYGLRSRAIALGWVDDNIVVVDSDQGGGRLGNVEGRLPAARR